MYYASVNLIVLPLHVGALHFFLALLLEVPSVIPVRQTAFYVFIF